jgi:hypothetical protein
MKHREELLKIIKTKLISTEETPLQKAIMTHMTQEGRLSQADFNKIMYGQIDIENISEEILVWLIQAAEKFDPNICKTSDYFTQVEIDKARHFVFGKEDIKKCLVFHKASQLAPNQYMCKASVWQLGILQKHNIITVVTEVQRDSRLISVGDTVVRTVRKNYTRIDEIKSLIADEKFYYNSIRLNLEPNNGLNRLQYNEDNETITIKESDLVYLIDGNHRSISCEFAISEYPEKADMFKNRFFSVLFTNETIPDSKKIFSQECNRQEISESHMKAMKQTTENVMIDMIKFSNNSDPIYKNRIVNNKIEIKTNGGYILFESLSGSLKYYYNTDQLKTQSQKVAIVNWLIEFLNEVTNIFVDDLIDFKNIKKKKWNVDTNAWFMFIALSSKLRNDVNWKVKLYNILSSIDWSLDNNPYADKSNRLNNNIKITDEFLEKYIRIEG